VNRNVLLVGSEAPFGAAIVERLGADGYEVVAVPGTGNLDAELGKLKPGFAPHRVVVAPRRPRTTALADLAAEDLIADTDEALVGAETAARYLLRSAAKGESRRLVLLSGWAIMGLPGATTASAICGGLVGLAKSWALELGPEGINVNAVVAGPGVDGSDWADTLPPIGRHPTGEEIAHAVAFLLDERSSGVNGQAMFVCGGLTPGIMPT
jgi:3-oxoacyl-[acyl-carrier protein] reductase